MRANYAAIHAIRERTGMSVTALAAATGIERSNLTHIEAGRRRGTAKQIREIAKALNVPLLAVSLYEPTDADDGVDAA